MARNRGRGAQRGRAQGECHAHQILLFPLAVVAQYNLQSFLAELGLQCCDCFSEESILCGPTTLTARDEAVAETAEVSALTQRTVGVDLISVS